jgi:hypothetical protein
MRPSTLRRYAVIAVAVAFLQGCSGSQPPIGAPGAMPQSRAVGTQADRSRSWTLPKAKSTGEPVAASYLFARALV